MSLIYKVFSQQPKKFEVFGVFGVFESQNDVVWTLLRSQNCKKTLEQRRSNVLVRMDEKGLLK